MVDMSRFKNSFYEKQQVNNKDIIFDNLNSLINKNILDNEIKGINVKKTMRV